MKIDYPRLENDSRSDKKNTKEKFKNSRKPLRLREKTTLTHPMMIQAIKK